MKDSLAKWKHTAIAACIMLASVFYTLPVMAADAYFTSPSSSLTVGQSFEVAFFIDTDSEDLNAFEGVLSYPQDLLEVKMINDGNSVINLWLEKPKITAPGKIYFSGIVPGGYTGKQGLILSVTFRVQQQGKGVISLDDITALRNDGYGTEVAVSRSNFGFSVTPQTGDSVTEKDDTSTSPPAEDPESALPLDTQDSSEQTNLETKDHDPPEKFTPQIMRENTVFGGRRFLIFATQDKGSGIDHYEVCEGGLSCRTAESPYLLQNQDVDEDIIVKAIDKSSNERIVRVKKLADRSWYKDYKLAAFVIVWTALLLVCILLIIFRRNQRK